MTAHPSLFKQWLAPHRPVGKTQKTVDIELMLPTTVERAFVQVKLQANRAELTDYLVRLKEASLYQKMFFVWHTGKLEKSLMPIKRTSR